MLRWLTLGFLGLSLAVVIAACNSGDTSALNGGLGIGPDFATGTLYAANSNQNSISIYLPNPANSASPAFQIGGSNTQLNGPQYLAFDTNSNLWITNYNASTTASSIDVIKALATGNVFPIGTITSPGLGQPRGIAIYNTNSIVGVAVVNPADPSPSQLQFYTTSSNGFTLPFLVIAGNLTMLNVPSGMAFDSTGHIYVTNRADASVETFVVPTPTPTPSPTTTPSPTPTPTPPTPTPSPTATPYNVAPTTRIFGPLTGLQGPTGVTLDTASIIYVSDAGNPPGVNPSVRIFAAGSTGNIPPIHVIAGSNTLLNIPTDVKVDSSGKIYIADSGTNKIYVYAAGVYGNVAPIAVLNVVGNVIGIGLAP